MCLSVFPTCMFVHRVCTWYLRASEEDIVCSGTGVTENCALPWGLNPGPLGKQPSLLTSESSLQLHKIN